MTYQVIPRKYRPRTFSEIVAQEPIVRTLQGAIVGGRLASAYLFCGPHGVGKTSTARILAKAINCERGPTPTPCLACPQCRDIAEGCDLDLREINGADHRGVDEVRAIIEDVRFAPSRNRRKIFILDEVHQLTDPAFNALLKTLEEPPPHVVFILATTHPNNIPPTILSRCQRYDFRKVNRRRIATRLREISTAESIEVSNAVLARIAEISKGSVRDAQKVLDQLASFGGNKIDDAEFHALMGLTPSEEIWAAIDAIAAKDTAAVLGAIDRVEREGRDLPEFVAAVTEAFRLLLLAGYQELGAEALDVEPEDRQRLGERSRRFTPVALVAAVQTLLELEQRLRRVTSHRVLVDLAFVKVTELADLTPLPEILARLEALEFAHPSPHSVSPLPSPSALPSPSPSPLPSPSALPSPSPAPPPPPVRAPASYPQATSSPPPLARLWAETLAEIGAEDPKLESDLSAGRPVSLDEKSLVIRFDPRARWIVSQLEETERLARVGTALARRLGRPVCVRLSIDSDPGPAAGLAERKHPAVLKAVEVFEGQVIEVRARSASKNETGSNE